MKGLYIKSIPFGKGAAGGGITHTIGMINGFFGTDVDLTVITTEAFDVEGDRIVNLNVPYNAKGLPFLRDYFFFRKYRKALVQWLKKNNKEFDFVYCRHRTFSNLPLVAKKMLGAYLILEQNDILYDAIWTLALYPNMLKSKKLYRPIYYLAGFILKKWVKKIEVPVLQAADKIVVVSEQMKKNLVSSGHKKEEDIVALPNGVDPNVFFHDETRKNTIRKQIGIPTEHVVIGFAGTFGNWHGIPELTECCKRIAPQENVSFLLMGDGLMKKEMQHTLKAFENVHFTGLVPFSDMPSYLDACDVLVISNSWDPKFNQPFFGSPTKLFEYMAMEKAIVASRLEQISEILTDEISALLFEPGKIDEMEHVIKCLIEDKELRGKLGYSAREQTVKYHTWRNNAEQILQIIRAEIN